MGQRGADPEEAFIEAGATETGRTEPGLFRFMIPH